MRKLIFFKVVILCLFFTSINNYAKTDYEVLDRIIAIVEKDVVTQKELDYEINKALMFYQANNINNLNANKIREETLQQLIEKKVISQYAESIGLSVSSEEIEFVLQNILKRNEITLKQFQEELKNNNNSLTKFKEELKNNLTIKKIKDKEIMPYVNISKFEIDAWLKKQQAKSDQEFKILHILIKNNNPKIKEKIDVINKKIEIENFKKVAATESEGPYAENGGDLGWSKLENLPSLFAKEVINMKIGEVKRISSSNGEHFIKLENIRNEYNHNKIFISEYKFQQILLKKNAINTNDDLKRKMENIKNLITDGLNFNDAVKQYSEDTLQPNPDELTWVNIENFLPLFKKQFEKYPKETLLGPFQTEIGWHLIKIYNHRENDISNESNKEIAKIEIAKAKTELRFKDWLNALIENSKIQIITD